MWGRGSIWSDGKGCAVGAFPSRMTVGMLIESMSSSIANSLVAVVSYSGYDLEDAVVFSKGSIDAGLSASSQLKASL